MSHIVERWKRGETVRVQAPRTGMIFRIRPEQWAGITIVWWMGSQCRDISAS